MNSNPLDDDAIASGHGAYLLEKKEHSNTFSANIGNLPPGKEILVGLVYITELAFDEGKLKLVLPVNPHSGTGTNFSLPQIKDTPLSKTVPYGLKLNISLDMSSYIKSVASATHPIAFEFAENSKKAQVRLALEKEGVGLEKDFEMLMTLTDSFKPIVRVETQPSGDSVAMVAIHPDLPDEQVFTEMIFLVDRSGSMSGSPITQVKDTLQIFLRSLPEGTLFNIIGFGTNFTPLFPSSQEYNEQSLQTAVKHVEKMTANLGGTNLKSPLEAIFKEKTKEGIPRQLFILTDGEVDNTQECLDVVRFHADTTRVFTFGIGNAVSKQLVGGLAKQGEGKAEFVKSGENLDAIVMRQLNRALKPSLVNLKVNWGSTQVKQTPYYLPPLFGGGRLVSYAFFPKDVKLPGEVVLTANSAVGSHKYIAKVENSTVTGSQIMKLASKSMIRDLEEKRSCFHDRNGNLLDPQISIPNEIISTSLASNVISKFTAFVAIEKRNDAINEGNMQLRKIEMTDALNEPQPIDESLYCRQLPVVNSGRRTAASYFLDAEFDEEDECDIELNDEENFLSNAAPVESKKRGKSKAKKRKSSSKKEEKEEIILDSTLLREIIKNQRANGSFSFDVLKLFLPQVSLEMLKTEFPSTTVNLTDEILEIFVTVIVCQYLQLKFADLQVNWNLVVKKAQTWVNKEADKNGLKIDLESAAQNLIK